MTKTLVTCAKFAISFGILAYLFNEAMADDQFRRIAAAEKNWAMLVAGVCLTLMAILIGLFRWKIFVNGINLPFHYVDAIRIGLIGQFFNLFAFGVVGGDALRAYYVSRFFPKRKSEAVATVFADRMVGMFTMFGIGAISFFFLDLQRLQASGPQFIKMLQTAGWFVTLIAGIGAVGAIVLFLVPNLHRFSETAQLDRLGRLGRILQNPRLSPIGRIFGKFVAVASVYRSRPGVILAGILLSCLTNVCFGSAIFCISTAICPLTPALLDHLFIEPIVMCCNAIPLPGGLGGMEFTLNLMYQAFGSPHGIAVAFGFRISLLLVAATGGIVWLFNRQKMARDDPMESKPREDFVVGTEPTEVPDRVST